MTHQASLRPVPPSPEAHGASLPVAMKTYGAIGRTYRRPRLMSVRKLIVRKTVTGTAQTVTSSAHDSGDRRVASPTPIARTTRHHVPSGTLYNRANR